ncbi:unnamed protein product [Notodromas monacha]|uniref:GDT1 family protein n=1 Tax=Notodromas monacha TaxID=399045 RepID=A0A7R9GAR9_9CRUS|nr:unnamed protein product [Notodromas monacha]CAG0914284.1 unnamed protein product [Notodromas monacha]
MYRLLVLSVFLILCVPYIPAQTPMSTMQNTPTDLFIALSSVSLQTLPGFEAVTTQTGMTDFPTITTPFPDWANATNSTENVNTIQGFFKGLVSSLSIVLVSEIGDKTFFIAAIMAMRHARTTVFLGALSALFLMTALSAALGYAVNVIPRVYTQYISAGLFLLFGLKMLYDGYKMSPDEGQEELEEVQNDLEKREEETKPLIQSPEKDQNGFTRPWTPSKRRSSPIWRTFFKIFLQAFTMTLLAEWGDRSQISTIVLAVTNNIWGVVVGGTLGHFLCTGVAVIGGRLLAQRISVKTITIIGGIVFLVFAVTSLFLTSDFKFKVPWQ